MELNSTVIKDVFQWDVANWGVSLSIWDGQIQPGMKCLELGSSKGGLSLWAALQGGNVVCSDISSPEEKSKPLHQKYGVEDKIQYDVIDATNMPYQDEFDIILFKSILGGIGRDNNYSMQKLAIDQTYKALKPGGKLLFAENLLSTRLHMLLRKKMTRWGKRWRYISIEEMQKLLGKFSAVSYSTNGFSATFGISEGQRQFGSHLDQYIFDRIVPNSWHYIIAGTAQK